MTPSVKGLGKIPVIPAITGTWPLNFFPHEVQIGGTTFRRATWAWPLYSGVVAQYREATEYDAMHLMIYRNGSFVIDHLDEANPADHALEHAILDVPLATTLVCGIAGFGLGLVGGLLLLGSDS
jgi:hypothetical protein